MNLFLVWGSDYMDSHEFLVYGAYDSVKKAEAHIHEYGTPNAWIEHRKLNDPNFKEFPKFKPFEV